MGFARKIRWVLLCRKRGESRDLFIRRFMELILIATDSKILLDQKIKEILKENTNVLFYHYPENTISDILEEASYVSLFQEEKYVIVKNADFFGKGKISEKDSEKLLQYIDNPYPCTTLIFTTYDTLDNRKGITKKMKENGQVVLLNAPRNYDLFLDIKKKMQKYQADDAVVRYIIEACLSNYDFLMNEIEKLELIYKPKDSIRLEEIKKIIVPNVNDNIFKFIDAVIQKDIYTSIHLFEDFLNIKMDALQLLNMLAREYRLIYYYKLLEQKNFSKMDMARELKLQDWQVEKLRKESSYYHKDDIKDYLILLSQLDVKIKSGQYEKNSAFLSFLMNVFEY